MASSKLVIILTYIATYPFDIITVLLSMIEVDMILEPLTFQHKGCFVVSPTIRS
jgi:hypothetical protein